MNMTLNKIGLKMLLLCMVLVAACQKDDNFPELSNPIPLKPALLSGTWTTSKVVQFDKEAVDNGFPADVQKKDLTTAFPFADFKIKFDLDATGKPGVFTVTPGNAPNFLTINTGNWTLDDYVFATNISLADPGNVNASAFRIKRLESNKISLQIVRNDFTDNTEYSYYEYEFTKN
jgi:hypothetical protein